MNYFKMVFQMSFTAALLVLSLVAQAEDQYRVKKIWDIDNVVYIKLEPIPDFCVPQANAHAKLHPDNIKFDEYSNKIVISKLAKAPIDLVLEQQGDCLTLDSVALVDAITN